MADRTIQKALIGEEDIIFGEGSVTQTRGGSSVSINKINADSIPYSGDVTNSPADNVSIKEAMQGADTIQDLINLNSALRVAKKFVAVAGFYAANDNGGTVYRWDATGNKTTHNGGTVIDPDIGITPGATGWWTAPASGTGVWVQVYNGNIFADWFGLIDGNNDDATLNLAALQAAVDASTAANVPLELKYSGDVQIDNTLFITSDTTIISNGTTQLLRTALTTDTYGNIAIISTHQPVTPAWNTNVNILGDLKLAFDQSLGLTSIRNRGTGTICLLIGNAYDSEIRISARDSEYACKGYSVFDTIGSIEADDCHKGLHLDPDDALSNGSNCTSLNIRVKCSRVVFPLDLNAVIYSYFEGWFEGAITSLGHQEATETSIGITTVDCFGVHFQFGVEVCQGMLAYDKGTGSSTLIYSFVYLVNATEHFEQDAARIDNIAVADQAIFSLQGAGSFTFLNTTATLTNTGSLTTATHMMRRGASNNVSIVGGYIDATNYTYTDVTDRLQGVGTRFFPYPIPYITDATTPINAGVVIFDETDGKMKLSPAMYVHDGSEDVGGSPFGAAGIVTIGKYNEDHEVKGFAYEPDGVGTLYLTSEAGTALEIRRNSDYSTDSGKFINFTYEGALCGYLHTTTGSDLARVDTSDYRLKDNIVSIDGAWDIVKGLNPRKYNFKSNSDITVSGFVAHELQEVLPEAVVGEKDAVDVDGKPEYQGVSQETLIPTLTAALKEAIERIEALEAKLP